MEISRIPGFERETPSTQKNAYDNTDSKCRYEETKSELYDSNIHELPRENPSLLQRENRSHSFQAAKARQS
jgi:hypothetical protein